MNDRTTRSPTTLPARFPRCAAALAALVAPVPGRAPRHARARAGSRGPGRGRQQHAAASIVLAVAAGVVVTAVTGAGPTGPAAAALAAAATRSAPGALTGFESGTAYVGEVLADQPAALIEAALVNAAQASAASSAGAPTAGPAGVAQAGLAPGIAGNAGNPRPVASTTVLPDGRAAVAIATAMAQLGLPYVWGGDGPTNGDAGFDCSGLTTFSYRAAGVTLPRTAHTQYYAGPRVPTGAPLHPGDLVFYGTPAFVHHVGMYLGAGRMINAPTFGKPVRTAFYRWSGDDYLGASRPAASGRPGTLPVPAAPAPQRPPNNPEVFPAPPAPLPVEPLPAPTDPAPPESDSAAAAIAAAALVPPGPPPGAPPPATSVPGMSVPAGPGPPVLDPTAPSPTAPSPTAPNPTAPNPTAPNPTVPAPRVSSPTVPSPAASTSAAGMSSTGITPSATATITGTPAPAPSTAAPPTAAPSTAAPSTAASSTPVPPPLTTRSSTAPRRPAAGPPPTTTAAGRSGAVTPTTPPRGAPVPASNPTSRAAPDEPAAGPAAGPRRSSITVAGTTVGLRTVGTGADGLPAAAGLWPRSGRPVVRLGSGSPLGSAASGSTLTLTRADGSVSRFVAGPSGPMTAAAAAQRISVSQAGTLVLLAPAGGGRWTVLRGTPTG